MAQRYALDRIAVLGARSAPWLAAVAVVMTACQDAPSRSRTAQAPSGGVQAPSSTPAQPPPLLTGSFVAVSTTAMGVTGDLALTATTLTFDHGLAYETIPAASVRASGLFARSAETWAALFGVTAGTTIEVRAVTAERVDPRAPNGGLCRPDTTSFVALASVTGVSDDSTLKVAAFKGVTPPGADASEDALCGTFTYQPR